MRAWQSVLPILLLLSGATRGENPSPVSRVDAGIERALQAQQRVRVMVSFAADPAAKGADAQRRDVARSSDAVLQVLQGTGFRLHRRFQRVPALALDIDATALARLQALPQVRRIDLDSGGSGAMFQSAPLANVTDTLDAGLLGAGAKIAVIDSGIDTDHADFAGRIVAQQCFCSGDTGSVGCCPNALDTMSGAGSAEDNHGHGTNVSGIAAGGGVVTARGAAPAASLVAVKVLDGTNSFCCASDIVAALDWVLDEHPDADVVNASLGTNALFTTVCDDETAFTQSMSVAVNNLAQNGTMVFASSGNARSSTAITVPACLQNAIAVGAVWDNSLGTQSVLGCTETTAPDKATCFTNSNQNVDLYAPGAAVTSSGRGGGISTFFGTSQATPLVAGCTAALRAAFPAATPVQLEAALENSPTRITDAKNGLQFPRLDCAAAAQQIEFGVFADGFED